MTRASLTHLFPLGVNPCTPDTIFREAALAEWLCGACSLPRASHAGAVDVRIQEERVPGKHLNFVAGLGVTVASKALTALLIEEVGLESFERQVRVGRVFLPSGLEAGAWLSIRALTEITVRGSRHAKIRRCSDCGRLLYSAQGARYLAEPLPTGVTIASSDLFGLVTSAFSSRRVRSEGWRGLGVEDLSVQEPADGLPSDLLRATEGTA